MLTRTRKDQDTRTDAEIARDVRRRMKADFEVPDDRVSIKVTEGLLTIEGTVVRDSQKKAAEACGTKVKGVRGITNKIVVEPTTSPVEA